MAADINAPTPARMISPDARRNPLLASFNASDILPHRADSRFDGEGQAIASMSSSADSDAGSFIFDNGEQNVEQTTEITSTSQDDTGSYDLKAPPPAIALKNAERLSATLFSVDHLNLILRDQTLGPSFAACLSAYRPHLGQVLVRYQEAQKAIAASTLR